MKHKIGSCRTWALGLALAVATGCGGDSLVLSLPQGNELKYTDPKPSLKDMTVTCDTVNASVYVSPDVRSQLRLRCIVELKDNNGAAITSDASIPVVAEVQEQGHAPEDGSVVIFTTSVGSFEPLGDWNTEPVKETQVETRGGKATALLYTFPGESGEATVTASYRTINESTVTDTVKIQVGTGLGVIVESGCPVKRVYEEGEPFVYVLTPTCDPLDVEPMQGEPSHMEGGTIHNPRDGLFAMTFYVDGEEAFNDLNGNGKYDEGEFAFGTDQGEPFVDANDNGQYDTGEPFVDEDGDGAWTDANGRWDEDKLIWKTARIMFTGPPHESPDTTHFEPSGINIAPGGRQDIYLHLMDINHNPIASNTSYAQIQFTVEGGANISTDTITLEQTMGVVFTDDGKTIEVSSFTESRTYKLTLEDADPNLAENVTVKTTVSWTPAKSNYYSSPELQQVSLSDITGTAQ